jgi:hypothetical protein
MDCGEMNKTQLEETTRYKTGTENVREARNFMAKIWLWVTNNKISHTKHNTYSPPQQPHPTRR